MASVFRASRVLCFKTPKSPVAKYRDVNATPATLRNQAKRKRLEHRNLKLLEEGENALKVINLKFADLDGRPVGDYSHSRSGDNSFRVSKGAIEIHPMERRFPGRFRHSKRPPAFVEYREDDQNS